jgi:hypothetical protein
MAGRRLSHELCHKKFLMPVLGALETSSAHPALFSKGVLLFYFVCYLS